MRHPSVRTGTAEDGLLVQVVEDELQVVDLQRACESEEKIRFGWPDVFGSLGSIMKELKFQFIKFEIRMVTCEDVLLQENAGLSAVHNVVLDGVTVGLNRVLLQAHYVRRRRVHHLAKHRIDGRPNVAVVLANDLVHVRVHGRAVLDVVLALQRDHVSLDVDRDRLDVWVDLPFLQVSSGVRACWREREGGRLAIGRKVMNVCQIANAKPGELWSDEANQTMLTRRWWKLTFERSIQPGVVDYIGEQGQRGQQDQIRSARLRVTHGFQDVLRRREAGKKRLV